MPIYEYRCASCGHELEALQKLSDAPLTVCPACNRAELVKRVSAAGFQLKGSGWYVTDFRNSGAKPAGKANGAATATGEAKAGEAKTGEAKSGEAASGAATPASGGAAAAKPTTTTSTEKS